MKSIPSKLVLLLFLSSSLYSFAWGLTGHRVIAEIAENHLSRKSKRNIKKLLGNDRLAFWANWPDFIKSDTTNTWKETNTWHYVNIDPQKDFKSFEDNLVKQSGANLYQQINVLSSQIKDPKTEIKDKRIALIFLIHLMGDLAQPLHVGRAEDQGGNKIQLAYFGAKTNLHSLWDTKLIESENYSYTEFAHLLDNKSKDEVKKIQEGSLSSWFYESHQLANKIYHDTPANAQLAYDYQYKYNAALEKQLLYGGLRLAKIINGLF